MSALSLFREAGDRYHQADTLTHLGDAYHDAHRPQRAVIVDETADAKSSADAVGAARQYSGTLGGVALCQVAVTLTYASGRGHALVDRSLYLPEARAADEEHRELAGIPDEVAFATKPQLAAGLLERAHERGIRAAFVTGDEVYGGRELRQAIRSRGMGYVLAVRSNTAVTPCSGTTIAAAGAVQLIPDRSWQRLRTGSGTKGVRHYDWAMLQITADDAPGGQGDGHSVLLIRRHRYTRKLSFYRCWTPGPVPLSRLIAVAAGPVADRGRSSARQAGRRPGLRAGHPVEILAPVEHDLPARLHLPRRHRCHQPVQRHQPRPDPRHSPRVAAPAPRPGRPRAPPRPRPPSPLVLLAPPPPVPSPPSPPAPERLRRHHNMITNYRCRNFY